VSNGIRNLPRNQRRAKIPAKFWAAAVRSVIDPKHAIIIGSARAGPYFFPSIACEVLDLKLFKVEFRIRTNGGANNT